MKTKNRVLIKKKEWESHWKSYKPKVLSKNDIVSIFTGLIKNYLPVNSRYWCLEIGCVPGELLISFNKLFGYKLAGVDYSDHIELVKENMKLNKIKDYKIYKSDLFKFNPGKKYDVVSSFGLIEHFTDPKPCIKKMASLVKRGGYLIIHVPNFRWFQYLVHYFSNKKLLETHNLKYMDIDNLEKIIHEVTKVKTIYTGYYGIIQDWPKTGFFPADILHYLTHGFNMLINKLKFNVILSNKYTSTDTIYIGKRL